MTMENIIELLVASACAYAIFIQLLRIIWLYFPTFIKNTIIYRARQPRKLEMLLYFLLAITALVYNIVITIETVF